MVDWSAVDWKDFTLAYPVNTRKERVLVGVKQHKIGAGRINGFGGEVEPGQTIGDATRAELTQESGLVAMALSYVGVVHFAFPDKIEGFRIHVSLVPAYTGEVKDTREMRPYWCRKEQFAEGSDFYDEMLPADRFWLPQVMAGTKVMAYFTYNNTKDFVILEKKIEIVQSLPSVYDRKAQKVLSSQLKDG